MADYQPMLTLEQGTWSWIEAGKKKHEMSILKRFVRGFMAGLFLSFGGMLVQILQADPWLVSNTPGLLKILQGAVFPVGLVMIVLFQVDLVTASQAIFIMSTIKRKVPLWAFLVDWSVCLIGNLAGALLFAGFVNGSRIFTLPTDAIAVAAAAVGKTKLGPTFGQILIRGIGCNMLVVIAVFQASICKDGISKIVASWFPIFVFVAAGFDHVVANFFIIPNALMTGKVGLSTGLYIWKSVISSFIGNCIGAAIIVVPLMILYGGDEFDPSKSSASTSLNGTVNEHTQQWTKDVEASATIP